MRTVLFVCVHNSGRSQMAEAFFNDLAGGRARAISAGTDPAREVNPAVVDAMREAGIDTGASLPKALTSDMLDRADLIITMGCGAGGVCPAASAETEDWALEDPAGKSPDKIREIRDEIRERVSALLETELR
jgi:protein-tyrosine-phosphatase